MMYCAIVHSGGAAMQSRGARNTGRNVIICLILVIASAIAIVTGIYDMIAMGHETGSTAARIGFGAVIFFLSLILGLNFLWGYRIIARLEAGETKFAGWTVSPADYDRFREIDGNFVSKGSRENDYRPLRTSPPGGVQVLFSQDGVLIGDRYFGLASTGLNHFSDVAMIRSTTPMIEFGMVTTTGSSTNTVRFRRIHSTLRVPVSSDATHAAERVLGHYQAVQRHEVIVRPGFWKSRIRFGLIGTGLASACAAIGFLLRERNDELYNIPLFMAVAGTIVAIAGLFLAGMSRSFDPARRRR
ncbi:hypothetical protein SAMN06295912_13030 [Sphingomonas laterariae]|uniref:Uncharacterized protein n=2 Tax=Edaphosphingomonas laterariae TaxID=861865 RepID=A0A239J5K7_9SPHN|nr:hypothetical protein SAMN06295912_13030 [Sphingomonas laterariae]